MENENACNDIGKKEEYLGSTSKPGKQKLSSEIIEQESNCNDIVDDCKANSNLKKEREQLCVTVLENYRRDETSIATGILTSTGREQGLVKYGDLFTLLPTKQSGCNGWITGDIISAFQKIKTRRLSGIFGFWLHA